MFRRRKAHMHARKHACTHTHTHTQNMVMSQTIFFFRKENRLEEHRQNFKLHTAQPIFVPSQFWVVGWGQEGNSRM